jgi:hypothetical protein
MKSSSSRTGSLSKQSFSNIFSAALALAYPQQPLYSSNQNTYLIHVVKHLPGYQLTGDWFAQTVDSFPLFTSATSAVVALLGESASHLLYVGLLFIFFRSLLEVLLLATPSRKSEIDKTKHFASCSAALFLLYCSPYLLKLLAKVLPFSTKLYFVHGLFTGGLAGQYITGSIYQPSVYGILLIASLALWMRQKVLASVALLGLTPLFHASYIISSLAMSLGYFLSMTSAGVRKAVAPALLYVFLVSIFVATNFDRIFSESTKEAVEIAQSILFDFRIPHHSNPSRWFGPGSLVQCGLMLAGVFMVRRTRAFMPILLLFILTVFGTILTTLLGSKGLALLFPWRSSVVLIPLSSALILSDFTYRFPGFRGIPLKPLKGFLALIVSVIMFFGIFNAFNYLRNGDLALSPLYSSMRKQYVEGDVFLINPGLQNARMASGVPVYVDFKSHPYRPEELIEWKRRIDNARNLYSPSLVDACPLAEQALSSKGSWSDDTITAIVDTLEDGSPGSRFAGCKNLRARSLVNGFSIYSLTK